MSDRLTIGVLSPLLGGYYYGGVLTGAAGRVAGLGGRIIAMQTLDADQQHPTEGGPEFDIPLSWDHVDGFISIVDAVTAPYLAAAQATGKPVVVLSQSAGGLSVPTVKNDNRGAIRQAVAHLVEHGHTRIGYVGPDHQLDNVERWAAYDDALHEFGIKRDPALSFVTAHSLEHDGYLAGRAALAAGYDGTAIIGGADYCAIGFMKALQEAGYDVPRSHAVIGIDNTEESRYSEPALTSVAVDIGGLGAMGVDVLVELIAGKDVAPDHRVPTTLITRESCGCASAVIAAEPTMSEREHVTVRMGDKRRYQEWIRTEYEIGMDLLGTAGDGAQALDWVERTRADVAYLGMWVPGAAYDRIRVDATYMRHGDVPASCYEVVDVRQFPPVAMLDLIPAGSELIFHVVRVRRRGSDWGLLAVLAPIETASSGNEETFNQWSAMLTVSLEHAAVLKSLQRSEERYAIAASATNDGLWDWDLSTDVVFYSDRWRAILAIPADVGVDSPADWFDRVHEDDRDNLLAAVAAHLAGETPALENEHRISSGDGVYRWMECRGRAVSDGGSRPTRVVGSLTDVTERKELQDQLRRDALYDGLTGLPNRVLFHDRLEGAIARSHRFPDAIFAVFFLDVDSFKVVNDSLGHLAGDKLLVTVAARLQAGLRAHDTASRFGGDEFAILVTDVREVADLDMIAARMQRELAVPVQLDGHDVVISAAIGIAASKTGYARAEDVLRDADIAMYRAKSLGKGNHAMFDVAMRATAATRMRMENDLRRAVDRGELSMAYQPVIDLSIGALAGFEALIRWRTQDGRDVPPDAFLPTAEESGLIIAIGEWTYAETCRQIAAWQDARPGQHFPPVSVNISNRQFWHRDLLGALDTAMSDAGLDATSLRLEITEGVIMKNPESALDILRNLNERGLRLYIDDFGTGYSSLEALHRFPLEALKIDKSFIARLGNQTRSAELVRSIIMMGSNLGLNVIAEGIENREQAEALKGMGCGYAQGYFFSRPTTPDAAYDIWCKPGLYQVAAAGA